MECRICRNNTKLIFNAKVLYKYNVEYYNCPQCNFIQTEKPYWLNEAYQSSINKSDTGLVMRNIFLSKSTSALLFFLFNRNRKFLDYAGGYGMFTRLMRDIGFDFYTIDPFTDNLLARGFDFNPNDKIELITSFETFEHFLNPIEEIEKILSISENIFFSTQLVPSPIPKPSEWWYYGLEHGQHISLYSLKTLQYLANKYNLNIYSIKGYHLFTKRKLNPLIFKFLIIAGRLGLYLIPKILMKTKTFQDHKNIGKEIEKTINSK